jgi:hypothetical protein
MQKWLIRALVEVISSAFVKDTFQTKFVNNSLKNNTHTIGSWEEFHSLFN